MGLDNPLHIAFLVVILLLVFGAKRLPEIGRSLGSGMREFKDSVTGESKAPALTQSTQQQPPPPQQAAQAFGEPAQPAAQAPAEPTHQA
jgi:sec-independent protein translocase protein TatA